MISTCRWLAEQIIKAFAQGEVGPCSGISEFSIFRDGDHWEGQNFTVEHNGWTYRVTVEEWRRP